MAPSPNSTTSSTSSPPSFPFKRFTLSILVSLLLAIIGFAIVARCHKMAFSPFFVEQWQHYPVAYGICTTIYLFGLFLYYKYKSVKALAVTGRGTTAPQVVDAAAWAEQVKAEDKRYLAELVTQMRASRAQTPAPSDARCLFERIVPFIHIGRLEEAQYFLSGISAEFDNPAIAPAMEPYRGQPAEVLTIGNMREELEKPSLEHIHHTHYLDRMHDSPECELALEAFDSVADHLKRNAERGIFTLLHCIEGKSRSVAFLIYFLMREYKLTLSAALGWIQQKRPFAKPNYGFLVILGYYEVHRVLPSKEEFAQLSAMYVDNNGGHWGKGGKDLYVFAMEFIENPRAQIDATRPFSYAGRRDPSLPAAATALAAAPPPPPGTG